MKLAPIITVYGGRKYRSRTEARWAVFFDAMGLRFQYEPEAYALGTTAYLPDFWIPDWRAYFEVKGDEPSEEEIAKCAGLASIGETAVLLAIGAPAEEHQILWFDRTGQCPGRYCLAQDRMVEAGFWLMSDEEPRLMRPETQVDYWLGSPAKAHLRRGPMLTGAIEQARDYACSAKFDHGLTPKRVRPFPHDPDRLESTAELEARWCAA